MSDTDFICLFPQSRLRFGGGNCTKILFSFLYLFLTYWPIVAFFMFVSCITGVLVMYTEGWNDLIKIYESFYLEDYIIMYGALWFLSAFASFFLSLLLVIICIRHHKLDTMIRILTCQHCRVDKEYLDDTDQKFNTSVAYQQLYK